ncbi:predicted protein [Aspergillus terreus NIH2624]|uniref:FAD/NAD(P)-binding domain-containing protein n=1 Tax=Aspergillus terreus (strain NIH 2624 / FGSC A1156) TaxID=341663 RepID=Q0CZ86_ASPTN|nr:uncharacterized protein ATEG_00998 [Aspergillus terreus NIH2624]EAU37755.1 predicted protein [Aspergillus terreus NIH2624]
MTPTEGSKFPFEVLIIGGGPSGLAAGLTLGRVQRRTLILDMGRYRNEQAVAMQTVPTNDGKTPTAYLEDARREIAAYPTVQVRVGPDNEVVSLERVAQRDEVRGTHVDRFIAKDTAGNTYVAYKVLMATGVADLLPNIDGFAELWGSRIFDCIYCHGYECRGPRLAILGDDEAAKTMSLLAASLFPDRALLTNGGLVAKEEEERLGRFRVTIDHREVLAVTGTNTDEERSGVRVTFRQGEAMTVDAVLHVAPTLPNSAALATQLGVGFDDGGNLATELGGRTSVRSLFVAGDASQQFKSVTSAVFTGNAAATLIHHELTMQWPEEEQTGGS